jgi:hypothetical protein
VQFHLINTTILFLSREGFRRGCLRAQQASLSSAASLLRIAALCIPFGLAITLSVCAVSLRSTPSLSDPYARAVMLQGARTSLSRPGLVLLPRRAWRQCSGLYVLLTAFLLHARRPSCHGGAAE